MQAADWAYWLLFNSLVFLTNQILKKVYDTYYIHFLTSYLFITHSTRGFMPIFLQDPSLIFVLQDLMDTLLCAPNLKFLAMGTVGHSLKKKKVFSLIF